MADLTPTSTVTFTVTSMPKNERATKTLRRLMNMQPEIQKGLSMLARRRAKIDAAHAAPHRVLEVFLEALGHDAQSAREP